MGYSQLIAKSMFSLRSTLNKTIAPNFRKYSILRNTSQAKVQTGIENLQIGSEYQGFKVESVQEVDDLALTAVRLTHIRTQADYLHIARQDTNNVFCVGFRTTPWDSTGVSHILEHTVLCGSKLYPCRDPFFRMLNRSLSTFMNAMTGPDYTIYPFSTQNAKDFQNLMSVYLDAVFHPHLRELDFLQEGWRLEHKDPHDAQSPLELKGVVFNEMKGAFSDPGSVLGQHLMNKLLPSNTYSHVSGGDPPAILNLTWEQLKNFHAKYYHPSNSRFYTYGNLPLQDHLKFINENYLSKFDRIAPSPAVPSESRWNESRRTEISCRPDPFAPNPDKQTSAVVSYLLTDIGDLYEGFVMQILSELLASGPNSPFYKNLLKPNIGIGYSPVTGYDGHTRDTTFTIGLQGIHRDDVESVVGIIKSTFAQAAEEGFDSDRVEAVLHSIELAVKNQSTKFGLSMIMGLTPLWNHSGNPVDALYINTKVEEFRRHLQENPNYLKDKIRQYFVDNPHHLVTVMSPDSEYEAKMEQQEKEILEDKCRSLTDQDRAVILEKGEKLAELQNKEDDFSCLPTLQLSDISPDVERVNLDHQKLDGVPLQISVQPTNGITYFRSVLSAAHLSEDLKSMLPLFCLVATKMGAGDMDYLQLDQKIESKTGGLSVDLHLKEGLDSTRTYEQGVLLSSYCLDRNLPEMFELWESIFNKLLLEDTNRFETLLRTSVGELVNNITYSGHNYAMMSAASSLTPVAQIVENTNGMTYIDRIKQLAEAQKYDTLLESLRKIASQLLRKDRMRCSINATAETQDAAVLQLQRMLQKIPGGPAVIDSGRIWQSDTDFQPTSHQTHHILPVPVNFVSKVLPGVSYLSADYAPLRVLASIMSSKFLHPEIREKGGAYGGGASASSAGLFTFYSYRDPRALETIQTFDRAVDWAVRSEYNDEAIKEAKLSVFKNLDSPTPPSSKGMRVFLSGISDEQLGVHRQQLINVTRDDLVRVSQEYLAKSPVHGVTLIGPPPKKL